MPSPHPLLFPSSIRSQKYSILTLLACQRHWIFLCSLSSLVCVPDHRQCARERTVLNTLIIITAFSSPCTRHYFSYILQYNSHHRLEVLWSVYIICNDPVDCTPSGADMTQQFIWWVVVWLFVEHLYDPYYHWWYTLLCGTIPVIQLKLFASSAISSTTTFYS